MSLATKNFLMSLIGSLAGAVSSIIISMTLSRALGPEGRGVLTQIILWPPIVANLIHAGWAIAITSRVSMSPENIFEISSSAIKIGSLLSIIGMVMSWFVLITSGSDVLQSRAAQIFLLYIPLATYECIWRALLEGSHKFKETSTVRGVISLLNAALITLAWMFNSLSIDLYIFICLFALALSSFAQLYILRRDTQRNYVDLLIRKGNNDWIRIAIKAIPYVLVTIMVTRIDLIILTQKLQDSAHQVGLYVAASSIGSGITLIAQSVVYALIPRVSLNGETFNPEKSSRNFSAALMVISLTIAIVLVPFGESIMKVLFGKNFSEAAAYILPSIAYTTIGGLISIQLSQEASEGKWKLASFTLFSLTLLCALLITTANISTVEGCVYLLTAVLVMVYIILNILNRNDY